MASNGYQIYLCTLSFLLITLLSWQMTSAASTSSNSAELQQEQEEAALLSPAMSEYEDPVMKRHLGSIAAYSGSRGFAAPGRSSYYTNDDNIYKFKRFLGSLARGGWFPRQFRGFVYSGPSGYQQKRHIGSVARLGWLPYKNQREDYHF